MASPDLGPLVHLSADGLLGSRKFDLSLEVGGATILTGANGTGKSTILRAIDRFGRGAWASLAELPFSRLVFEFESGRPVTVRRHSTQHLDVRQARQKWEYKPSTMFHDYRVTFGKAFENFTFHEHVLDRTVAAPSREVAWPEFTELPGEAPAEWLSTVVDDFNVLFVTDQRLVVEDKQAAGNRPKAEPVRAAVTEYADDLKKRIAAALVEYGQRAQVLDRAFPESVVSAMRQPRRGHTLKKAVDRLREVEMRREALQAAGLIPPDEPAPAAEDLRENEVPVMRTYAETAIQKYAVLDDLLKRVTTFTEFLNSRYSEKKIAISQQHGFVITLGDSEETLAPKDLSSGEQQLLVLAYQIIFLTFRHTLVLVDEPELSLHVNWQTKLIDDLVGMGKASELSFLVATHSPTLIGGRRRIRRSLDPSRV